jgi:nitrogen-specific signal transduction histidine kinase
MVSSVLSICRMSLAHTGGVSIVWQDEDAALPALVLGDADRLSQVLLNLLTSALGFVR